MSTTPYVPQFPITQEAGEEEDSVSTDESSSPEISKWVNDFYPQGDLKVTIEENLVKLRAYRLERMTRLNSSNTSLQNMPPNPILLAGTEIHDRLAETVWTYCKFCNERWLDVKISRNLRKCPKCLTDRPKNGIPPTFSAENDMHARDPPEELVTLNQVEQAAVSRIQIVVKVYRLRGGATFLKGHCIAFEADLPEFVSRLPPLPSDLPMIVLIAPGQSVPLKANRNKILSALKWLIDNNPFYEDLDIDFEALNKYPANYTDNVQGLETIEDPDLITDEGERSTVYTPTEFNTDLTYSTLPQQMCRKTLRQTITDEILGRSSQTENTEGVCSPPAISPPILTPPPEQLNGDEDSELPTVDWPSRSSTPVSEWTSGYMSMAFPYLPGLCYGECDITVSRMGKKPSLFLYINHLLKHPSRAFAQDPRWLLAMCNRYLRDKAFSTGNVFAKNNARDITMGQLKEQVAAGDDKIFNSLLSFSKSIPGTRQYWKYKVGLILIKEVY